MRSLRVGCLHELVSEQVGRSPDAVAVVDSGSSVSFGELEQRSSFLAGLLVAAGVGPERTVAVCASRSVDLVVALLGVLKAGAAYVPLDPEYPVERLRFMVADSGASLVLVDGAAAGLAEDLAGGQSGGCSVWDLTQRRGRSQVLPETGVRPENLAYVIYTSGSTGVPKGVMVQHDSIVANLADLRQRYALCDSDAVLALSALSFDMSVFETLGVLAAGAAIVCPDPARLEDPMHWWDLVVRSRVTVLHAVPSRLVLLMDAAERFPDVTRGNVVRVVLSGGDHPPSSLPRRAREVLGDDVAFHNLGGVTEASIYSNTYEVPAGAPDHAAIPYGRAMSGQRLDLLGDDGLEVPTGVVGELFVGGAVVTRGYARRPGLTAERFLPDPNGPAGARRYRTGDLGRKSVDGCVSLVGRADQQLKKNGLRIEAGEVESLLAAHPGVTQAVVTLVPDAHGDVLLTATVVPTSAAGRRGVSAKELRDHLVGRLPWHMVPERWRVVERLPMTANNKVDRAALSRLVEHTNEPPAPVDEALAGEPDVPETEWAGADIPDAVGRTAVVVDAFAEVTGANAVGPDDSIFALGGSSMALPRLALRLREVTGVPVGPADIAHVGTPRAVAELLTQRDLGRDATERHRDASGPLTPFQQRIWYFEVLDTGVPLFNVPVALALPPGARTDVLAAGLGDLVARHASLRTRFVAVGGRPRQEVRPGRPVDLVELEASTHAVPELLATLVRQPFELTEGQLLRAVVVRVDGSDDVLLVTLHHLVCDAWSVDLIVYELGRCYADRAAGRTPRLPPAGADQIDAARRWEKRSSGFARHLDYWERALAGAPELLQLPTDRARPVVASHVGERLIVQLGEAQREGLLCAAATLGCTPYVLTLAAFATVLHRWTGQDDLVIGTLAAVGREEPDLVRSVGYLVNILPIRIDLTEDPDTVELVARVRSAVRAALEHKDVPFEAVVRRLSPRRDPSYEPLCQVLVNLHEQAVVGLPFADATSRRGLEAELGGARCDLTLDQTLTDGGIELCLEFSSHLFDRSTARRILEHHLGLLTDLASGSVQRLADSTAFGARESSVVSALPPEPPLRVGCLHELVSEQVGRSPDAVAVVDSGSSVSFGELEQRSSFLAGLLVAAGVGPERTVAVCASRSVDLVVALLGVLKAGAAYVPLDPEYPVERLRFMVADSGASLVLVDGAAAGLAEDLAGGQSGGCSVWDLTQRRGRSQVLPETGVRPENLAYVIYTSGSTGVPKGVMVQHDSIVSFLRWNQRVCGLGIDDRVVQNHSVAFDNSVWEIFQCLVSGAQLHLPSLSGPFDAESLVDELAAAEVTSLNATPSQMRVLLAADRRRERSALESLRLVFTGAESVPADLAADLIEHVPASCRVFNEYGPTEATITSAFARITPSLLERHRRQPSVPFGSATDNARLYVLDANGRVVPRGVTGELYLGGACVGRGYLGRPGRTAQSIVPDPRSTPGAVMYRSGDLVRMLDDGNLVFLGRTDHQVKVRGYRVELEEVERAVRRHPRVSRAVVRVRGGSNGDSLECTIEPTGPEDRALVDDVRAWLVEQLPAYMVPSRIVVRDGWTLTPSGKLDWGPAPDADRVVERATSTPPGATSGLERTIADLWCRGLGVDDIGRDDNFFDVGGHSLLVAELCLELGDVLGRRVRPVSFFQAPTVARLARLLDDEQRGVPDRTATPDGESRRRLTRRLRERRATFDGSTSSERTHSR